MIAYYEARLTKYAFAVHFTGEELDQVVSRINMFFFRIDSTFMEPFAIYISQSKFIMIDYYIKLLDILLELSLYITKEEAESSLFGLQLWKRPLVTLYNNVVDIRDTSTAADTLGDLSGRRLAGESPIEMFSSIVNEHVKSYYEGVHNEVNELRLTINQYHSDLTKAVGSVNDLLQSYKEDGQINKQFIR